jgi:Fe-S cluster biogenesis protein NfuA/nitrite reductase/ring-hydroxylating ferredoxin subunit
MQHEAEEHQPTPDLRATGERIDALIEAVAVGGVGPSNPVRSRERAEELVRTVTDLYGAGLERLLEIVYDSGRLDEELLDLLAADDLVASLLLVHGLHPYSVRTRVGQALESVRPYLGTHGGDVELVEVTDQGAVRLRLLGSCDGCPSSAVTLELAVQDAIEAAAPEVTSIEVEAAAPTTATGSLIPVDALRARLGAGPGAAWHRLPATAGLSSGQSTVTTVGDTALFVCRVGGDLLAFADRCGRCAGSLAGALPVRRLGGAAGDALLTCPGCAAHFDVRRAGACLDVPGLHLDPLPVLVEGGEASVSLPVTVPA